MRPNALVTAVGFLLASAPLQARQDAQSKYEPRSNPGAGQKLLERLVGDWDVAKTFHPRAGEPVRAEGRCRQTMIHGGRFLQSEFVFGQGDAKTTGLGLIGFDTAPGTFTSVWTDSRSTRMSMRQSRGRFDGEQIMLESRSLDAAEGGDSRRSRTVTRLEDGGRKIVHRQYALGQGDEERLMMELIMTRRDGGATTGK
jgi:hypothetical protein